MGINSTQQKRHHTSHTTHDNKHTTHNTQHAPHNHTTHNTQHTTRNTRHETHDTRARNNKQQRIRHNTSRQHTTRTSDTFVLAPNQQRARPPHRPQLPPSPNASPSPHLIGRGLAPREVFRPTVVTTWLPYCVGIWRQSRPSGRISGVRNVVGVLHVPGETVARDGAHDAIGGCNLRMNVVGSGGVGRLDRSRG